SYPDNATQLIAVLPPNPELFYSLESKLTGIKVIRATSPLDGESIWMEIFPEGVSKGHSVDWLCNYLGDIQPNEILAIGNDYNDLDLLDYTPNSYLVANAPDELKQKFKVVASNDESGFAEAVKKGVG
nr:HAD hydrolase family protein [Tenuifilaceae bacterium]